MVYFILKIVNINDETIHVMGGKPKQKSQQESLPNNEPIMTNASNNPQQNQASQPTTGNRSNQPIKFDFNSMLNNMMQNPEIIQMATQMISGKRPEKTGSGTSENPLGNLMGMLGTGGKNLQNNEEERKKETTQKKNVY